MLITFEVSAVESSGRKKRLPLLTSCRLSQEDIERMVKEGEQFKDEDEAIRRRVESSNKLENYCYSLRSSMLDDSKMKEALGDDASTLDTLTQETLDWVESDDGTRTAEEYDERYKEVEGTLMPLVQKAYQANMPEGGDASGGMPGGMPVVCWWWPGGMSGMPDMNNLTPEQKAQMEEMMKNMGGAGAQGGTDSTPSVEDVD